MVAAPSRERPAAPGKPRRPLAGVASSTWVHSTECNQSLVGMACCYDVLFHRLCGDGLRLEQTAHRHVGPLQHGAVACSECIICV